jgi:hypothetical protein
MKLYTTGLGHWGGTQADARKLKKQHGTPCELYEVPVSKEDLLAFLNRNTVITDVAQATAQPPDLNGVPQRVMGEGGTENYIGKTSVLAAGDGIGAGEFKLHIYFYTEEGRY